MSGMAIQYANLGLIFQKKSDLYQTREVRNKALVLITWLGSPHAKIVQSWLDSFKN